MKLIIDIETDRLINPTKIWCVVCREIDTGEYYVFRNITENEKDRNAFLDLSSSVTLFVGHNVLDFDLPVLHDLVPGFPSPEKILEDNKAIDTLIVSRMVDYSRADGHSVEAYGREFQKEKIDFTDFSKYSKELEEYCKRDVDITYLIYLKYLYYLNKYTDAIDLEHRFQLVCNHLSTKGFSFNSSVASSLEERVTKELQKLDSSILKVFPPKEVLVREFTPKATKYGTINKSSVPVSLRKNIHEYEIGKTYKQTKFVEFNPASHKQIVDVLSSAGWSPTDKTTTHLQTERELNRLKYLPKKDLEVDLRFEMLSNKIIGLKQYGWKINEQNLNTLPVDAPLPARTLARRILFESRRRTLHEWLSLARPDSQRIHGSFSGIGAWTHRMAHQKPNTANIPNDKKEDGSTKLLGKELRSLWQAPANRLLVGVDAEGIQLRIFAHYIQDQEFTDALIRGSKSNRTDPHSLNQRVLGSVCKSRQAAKRFIYALLLGAGLAKLSQVLDCSEEECKKALDNLLRRYQGWKTLRETDIPRDAKRGYFHGVDGRKVLLPGTTLGERKHLVMSGYLQNGEAIIIKRAALIAEPQIEKLDSFFVDIVHDEFQVETPADKGIAIQVAKILADAITSAGEHYKLKCPMAGSYWSDEHNDYSIGQNWSLTH